MRPHTQDPHHLSRALGQRITDGFRKRGEVIRRVVVNEQDLIGGIGQHLRHAIQTEGTALVKIVFVAVISTIKNNRNYLSYPDSQKSGPTDMHLGELTVEGRPKTT